MCVWFPLPRLDVIMGNFCASGAQKSSGDGAKDCHRGHNTKAPTSWQLPSEAVPPRAGPGAGNSESEQY